MITEIFEKSFARLFCLAFSIILTIATTPVMYLIIMFERDNPYKILMNQLVTSIAYLGIVANSSIELIHVVLYSWGPLHPSFCYLSLIFQGTFALQVFLLLNAVMIVRYIFTFHVKNPTAAQHDFWMIFITTCTFLLAFFTHSTFTVLPGKHPIQFYVCIGAVAENDLKGLPKINYPFITLFILTIVIHVCLGIKIKSYELKVSKTIAPVSLKADAKAASDKNRILSATINLVVVLIWILVCLPAFLSLKIETESINQYPNYLLVYYLHLVSIPTYILVAVSVVLLKNRQLRAFIMREVSIVFQSF